MKKNNKAIVIGNGENCPKCFKPMERRKHPPHWVNRKNYYFTEWDYCTKCNHTQLYEKYKSQDWQEDERQESFFRSLRE